VLWLDTIAVDESALAPHSNPLRATTIHELPNEVNKSRKWQVFLSQKMAEAVACIKRYLWQGLRTARSCEWQKKGLRHINDPHESECHRSGVPVPPTLQFCRRFCGPSQPLTIKAVSWHWQSRVARHWSHAAS